MVRPRPIDALVGPAWREQYVHANGVRQHIWRTGGDGPAVVALPGFQEIGLTWARAAKRLEQEFDVIMVDFRGQGRTELGAETYSQALLTRDIAALVDALGLTRVSLLGFSNGAGVAAELAATHPEAVRCVVLEDPPRNAGRMTAMADSSEYRAWHAQWLAWLEQFKTLSVGEQLATIVAQIPGGQAAWDGDDLVAFAESYAQLDVELVRDPGPIWAVANRSVATLLDEIRCPVLLTESTRPMPGAAASTVSQPVLLDASRVTRVGFETGHFIRREQFDAFMALVEPFLGEYGRSRSADT
jgi:pimeloyl-ACP methyl ester carboxylesterase